MSKPEIENTLQTWRDSLEDIGEKPSPTQEFLTAFAAKLDLDLAYRVNSSPAARELLYSMQAGHSDALQKVRFDKLLNAIYHDLQAAKVTCIGVYQDELPYKVAGEFDEEDLAQHDRLAERIKKLSRNMEKIAAYQAEPEAGFELAKEAVDVVNDMTKQRKNVDKGAGIKF